MSEPIKVQCGKCGKTLNAPERLAGKQVKCPGCGEAVPVPGRAESEGAPDDRGRKAGDPAGKPRKNGGARPQKPSKQWHLLIALGGSAAILVAGLLVGRAIFSSKGNDPTDDRVAGPEVAAPAPTNVPPPAKDPEAVPKAPAPTGVPPGPGVMGMAPRPEDLVLAQAAPEPTREQIEFFEKKIRPVLAEHCYKCHSNETGKRKGGLALDTRQALMEGGENGSVIVPGDPAKSRLITAISYKNEELQMPPGNKKLSDQQIADLTRWVEMGAPDPRKGARMSGLTAAARQHWSFQPVKRPNMPMVKDTAWGARPIDAFILQKLEAKGMAPSPKADKEVLLRRATYDLTGLPPTLLEIIAFVADRSPNAFEKVVDRLLASPHYGERWARHWLDTARYADTSGDREQRNGEYRYPHAWTYRDYVIRAFIEDKPYDRFILEQLAADQLPDLKNPRDRAALGFLPVGHLMGSIHDIRDDRIDAVCKGFLGLTVTCARCHDHKFDPIPTKDYYALYGVIASTAEPKDSPIIGQTKDKKLIADFEKKLADLEQTNQDIFYKYAGERNADFRAKAAAYILARKLGHRSAPVEDQDKARKIVEAQKLDRDVVDLLTMFAYDRLLGFATKGNPNPVWTPLVRFTEGRWKEVDFKKLNPAVAAAFAGKTPKSFEEVADIYGQMFARLDARGREYVQACAAAKGKDAKVAGFDGGMLELVNYPFQVTPANLLTTEQLRKELANWPMGARNNPAFTFPKMNELKLTHEGAPARAMIVADLPKPLDMPVFIRGQPDVRGEMVPRRFLEVLSPNGKPVPFKKGSGRLELAQAIASKDNPLTARVLVNRVWMHHFGEGIVRTPDDLGTQSDPPSHPELLDYLAWQFMEDGWSIKKLHKHIMLSNTYRQSSANNPSYAELDPGNTLLWRANIRRLDFEAMRDTLLFFSGKLDPAMGGPPENLMDEPYSYRRSIYGYVDRGSLPELMAHFDFSDPHMPNSKRATTVVPQQALFLMNSPLVMEAARGVMARPDVALTRDARTTLANIYRIIFQRTPTKEEVELAFTFLTTEFREEPNLASAAKALTEQSAKKVAERKKQAGRSKDRGLDVIHNEGEFVERRSLNPGECLVQALLLSNEVAYVR